MTVVLTLANNSKAREVVIILDCCHSGCSRCQVPAIDNQKAILREGVSVLSAARETELAMEKGGAGVCTSLICEALSGGAADVCGKVIVASQPAGAASRRPPALVADPAAGRCSWYDVPC